MKDSEEKKKAIKPIRFLNEEEEKESKKDDKDAELNFNCKYGDVNIKLSKIPFIKDIF